LVTRKAQDDIGHDSPHAVRNWSGERLSDSQPTDESILDLGGFVRVLSARKAWIYGAILLFVTLAGVFCLAAKSRYKATATIEVLSKDQATLSGTVQSEASPGISQAEDSLNFSLTLQTQVSILTSDVLALQVIKELNLAETPDFIYSPLFKTGEARRNMEESIDQSALKRSSVLKVWAKHLKVESIPGTRMISVSFFHTDAVMAAAIVNRLVADFIEFRFAARYQAEQRSANWVSEKLASLKAESVAAQNQVAQLQKDTGTYGPDQEHNIIISRLEQLNTAAADAEAQRSAKETTYKLAKDGDPELVSGLVTGNNQNGGAPSLLISLRQQEADLSGQVAEASTKYGAENPKLIQLKNRLEAMNAEIGAESQKITGRASQEFKEAVAVEAAAHQTLQDQKQLATEMNQKTLALEAAKHEAESAHEIYQQMLERVKKTRILAGIHPSDITLVDSATAPGYPASPRILLILAAATFAGLIFGVGAAFFRDALDASLRHPEDVEAIANLPLLGIIPLSIETLRRERRKSSPPVAAATTAGNGHLPHKGAATSALPGTMITADSEVMEAYRAVRTMLMLSRPDNPRQVFLVTSALPAEGKSFTALHLAFTLAENGNSVLLVDGDLRRGTLSRRIGMSSLCGLSTMFARDSTYLPCRPVEWAPGLNFLPAGAASPNPAGSLGSAKMELLVRSWRESFDYVVIDSPPVLQVTDAVLLSKAVDGVVAVVRFAVSSKASIRHAARLLADVNSECFGVVVNAMDKRSAEYCDYRGVYGSGSSAVTG